METRYNDFAVIVRDGPNRAGDLAVCSEQFERDIYCLAALAELPNPETILDIGGHIGCFGLKAKKLWPRARLIAYEPNQESAALYRRNLAANDCAGEVMAAAVSYEPTKTALADNPAWAGGGIMVEPGNPAGVPETYRLSERVVPLATLEQVVERHGLDHIDLLKLDCEGAEIEILRQMEDETAARIGYIVGEYHWNGPGYFGFSRLVAERFPAFAVTPLGKPSANIGLFAAGPSELIGKLRECDLHQGPVEAVITPAGNAIALDFMDGARVDVIGQSLARYMVRFDDLDSGLNIYTAEIGPGQFAAANPKYYVRWRVMVEEDGVLVLDHHLDLKNRRVLVVLTSKSLGDTVAWMPYAEEFRRRHDCTVDVETFWKDILSGAYPEIRFFEPGRANHSRCYAGYRIGAFDNDRWRNKNNWRLVPLQQTASDALGMEFREIHPRVVRSELPRPIPEKYVAISEFSTFKGKAWNHPAGWREVVRYLRGAGYQVVSVSREATDLPDVIRMNDRPIQETIRDIQHADIFIGVSSGLVWLAHALGVPAAIISGFTDPYSEMTDCVRIHNSAVCHGCYNDPVYPFDRANWNWCPRNRNFECSKAITPEMVIAAIGPLVHRTMEVPAVWINQSTTAGGRGHVLFLAPHLSTGGMPQYLLACVRELLAAGLNVEVVEWACLSPHYIVQRKQIERLCRLHSLSGDAKGECLRRIVDTFRPTIVHTQEFVESWMPTPDAEWLFRPDRSYRIIETSHDIHAEPRKKRYRPDGLALVCDWHVQLFSSLGIPSGLIPYHVEPRVRPQRTEALGALGLDPGTRHVLTVGLFTPNKAQDVVFDLARCLSGVMFHFVGNQAPNFAHYWGPLMARKPPNCIVWGEREDVEKFYAAMDLLLFPSRSELAPLVPREALAWQMPVMIRRLPQYAEVYDNNPLVTFLPDDGAALAAQVLRLLLPTASNVLAAYGVLAAVAGRR